MENSKDYFFRKPLKTVPPFAFNQEVADIFDDMVSRSVPFYQNIQHLTCDLINYFLEEDDLIYDLGCSTGTTGHLLSQLFPDQHFHYIGIDSSEAMIKKCHEKLYKLPLSYEAFVRDVTSIPLKKCGVVIMNYVLQFLKEEEREELVKKIAASLRSGGIFVLSEKIHSEDSVSQNLITDLYYDYKRRQGYNNTEIFQKREALENYLITDTVDKHTKRLKDAGFSHVEMLFRWYNFVTFVGIK